MYGSVDVRGRINRRMRRETRDGRLLTEDSSPVAQTHSSVLHQDVRYIDDLVGLSREEVDAWIRAHAPPP